MQLIDSHCHLTHARFADDVDDVVRRAAEAGVVRCLTIGTGVEDARRGLELQRRFPDGLRCSAGIDPFTSHRLGGDFDAELQRLEELLRSEPICAVGEVGLDYHYDLDPPAEQARRLEAQLDLARRLDLPVVIHVRDAHRDMLELLRRHPDSRGVIHSFTAGPAEARRYLDLGWFLAFNGVLTFNSGGEVREAAAITPEDRLLLETDSPYLSPAPRRGRRCEPASMVHTLQRLADVRGAAAEEVARVTTDNARRLFFPGDAVAP